MAIELQTSFLIEKFGNMTYKEDLERSMSQEPTESDFEISVVDDEDKKDIVAFARKFFNRDEPLNECIGLTGPDGCCPDLETYITSTIADGTSVKAVSNGKLVAFSMNGVVCRDDQNGKPYVDDPKFQLIMDFLHYNTMECDLFRKFPNVDKAMSVKIISVNPCMRGKGIATKLVQKTREIAREENCKLMFVECTSYFSALIMKKLGFEKIYTLNYSDYKIDGKVVFNPKEPHSEYCVYVQDLV